MTDRTRTPATNVTSQEGQNHRNQAKNGDSNPFTAALRRKKEQSIPPPLYLSIREDDSESDDESNGAREDQSVGEKIKSPPHTRPTGRPAAPVREKGGVVGVARGDQEVNLPAEQKIASPFNSSPEGSKAAPTSKNGPAATQKPSVAGLLRYPKKPTKRSPAVTDRVVESSGTLTEEDYEAEYAEGCHGSGNPLPTAEERAEALRMGKVMPWIDGEPPPASDDDIEFYGVEPEYNEATGEHEIPHGCLYFKRLDALIAEPPDNRPYVWDQVLPSDGTSILVSAPKMGKSAFIRTLAMHVSRGLPYIGRATLQGPVLILALEDSRGQLKSILSAFPPTGVSPIWYHVGRIYDEEGSGRITVHEQLARTIQRRRPVLVIVDTIINYMAFDNVNEYGEVYAGLRAMHDLAREAHTHIMLLHHNSKVQVGKTNAKAGNMILGSTAFAGAVDTQMFITLGKSGARNLHSDQRYGENMDKVLLVRDPRTGFILDGSNADAMASDVDALVEWMKQQDKAVMEKDIWDAFGWTSRKYFSPLIAVALASGKILRSGQGRKGNPFYYHMEGITPPPPEQVSPPRAILKKRPRPHFMRRPANKDGAQ